VQQIKTRASQLNLGPEADVAPQPHSPTLRRAMARWLPHERVQASGSSALVRESVNLLGSKDVSKHSFVDLRPEIFELQADRSAATINLGVVRHTDT
jgi:hypothetical protein